MPVEKTNLEEPVCSAKGAGPIVVEAVSVRADTIALERKQISSVSARRASSSRTLAALVTFLAANFSAAVECTDQLPRPLIESVSTNLHSASLTGKPESWWMVKQYLHRQQPPAVVLLGSSQMQCFYTSDAANSGHDVDELLDHDCKVLSEQLSPPNTSDSANASCFNASLAGSMISDRYLVDKALFTPGKTPHTVVLGIAPRDFIDNTLPSISATEPFQFFAPCLDVAEMEDSAFPSKYDKYSWDIARKLPLRHCADDLLARQITLPWAFKAQEIPSVESEQMTARADTIVVDNKPFFFATDTTFNVKPGKCLIPHTPFKGFINNNHEYAMRYKRWNTSEYKQQMRYLDLLLADLTRKHVRTLLVAMPLDTMNAALLPGDFWHDYSEKINSVAAKNRVSFFDLARSSQFEHCDFADGVHLNWRGANKLAGLLANKFARSVTQLNRKKQRWAATNQ